MFVRHHAATPGAVTTRFFRGPTEERRQKGVEELLAGGAYRAMDKVGMRQPPGGKRLPQLRERGGD
jgi:hypothetical protein